MVIRATLFPFVAAVIGTLVCMQGLNSLGPFDFSNGFVWTLFAPVVVGLVAGAVSARGRRPLGWIAGLVGACIGTLARDPAYSPSSLDFALVICVGFTIGYAIFVGLAIMPWRAGPRRGHS